MQELSENDFEQSISDGLVLVDFSAEWCGPCKTMLPVVKKIADEYAGRVSVYSVDIDKSPSLAARHGVMSVPTFIVFKKGSAVERVVGAVRERDLRSKIDQHTEG